MSKMHEPLKIIVYNFFIASILVLALAEFKSLSLEQAMVQEGVSQVQINHLMSYLWKSELLFYIPFLVLIVLFCLLQREYLMAPVHFLMRRLGRSKTLPDSTPYLQLGQLERVLHTLDLLGDKIKEMDQTLLDVESEKKAILESLEEGVIAVNGQGVVTYINLQAKKIFSSMNLEVGVSFFQIIVQEPHSLLDKSQNLLKNALATKKELTGECERFISGHKCFLDLLAAPIVGQKGAVLVLRDSTSQKKIVQMGKDFIANASHELRTPITIIKGFAETLHDMPELSSSMLEDILEKVMRNCQRMELLVKNLLLLADLDSTAPIFRAPCDLVSLIEQSIHAQLAIHPDVMIETLYNQDEMVVEIDAGLLEIAIMNLLQNAIKYSRPPVKIVVTLEVKPEGVYLSVQDHGIGIAELDLEHVFDRFYTANKAHSRKLGGAGLGLSIVKLIVTRHEGKISVSSALGQGSTFSIFLPCAISIDPYPDLRKNLEKPAL